jgi:hypothetical protein
LHRELLQTPPRARGCGHLESDSIPRGPLKVIVSVDFGHAAESRLHPGLGTSYGDCALAGLVTGNDVRGIAMIYLITSSGTAETPAISRNGCYGILDRAYRVTLL